MTGRYTDAYPYLSDDEAGRRIKRGAVLGALAGVVVAGVANVLVGEETLGRDIVEVGAYAAIIATGSALGTAIDHARGVHHGRIAAQAQAVETVSQE